MSDVLVPYGYAGSMLTWGQMEGMSTWNRLHPEFQRRFKCMSQAAAREGVELGVGTGWRIQPDPPPPGFAAPGNSNHEGFDPGNVWAVAIDTVPEAGWPWMERNCATYGLRTFTDVNDEPWHCQPSDIPASRSYRTQRWDLAVWPLPEEDEVTDADIAKIVAQVKAELPAAVWAYEIDTSTNPGIEPQAARRLLHRGFLIMAQYLGSWNGKPAPTETMLERIDKNTR